jgi:hypothetical protein
VLALAMVAGAAFAGPISKLKTMQFEPDLDAIIVCKAVPCGLAATCATVMEIDDVRTVRTRTVDVVRTVRLVAGGPLADRLWAVGEPGQRIRANGRGMGNFIATELILPTGDIDQELAGAAMAYAARCAEEEPATVERNQARPVEAAGMESDHLLPAVTSCNAALAEARSALVELQRYPACPAEEAAGAVQRIDEYHANDNPIRRK